MILIGLCKLHLGIHFDSINCEYGVLEVLNVKKKFVYVKASCNSKETADHI
jgi:hypothetical protein